MDGLFMHDGISDSSIAEFNDQLLLLTRKVDKIMTKGMNSTWLIGDNPLPVMYDNHENHARFISNVLKMRDLELLNTNLPWVLKSYEARGISRDYFSQVLEAWKSAISSTLSPEAAADINKIYDWMMEKLPEIWDVIDKLKEEQPHAIQSTESRYESISKIFTGHLLNGDFLKAQQIAADELKISSIQDVYMQIIQPAMCTVGKLWEMGSISVAHEHLATSIVMRLLSYFYPEYVIREATKGKVLVTASVNEFHEIGARMVADLLEIDGWDVHYLGADMPVKDLVSMAEELEVFALCISVTMGFNIQRVKELIQAVRNNKKLAEVKILVGGRALTMSSHLPEFLGADAVESSAVKGLQLLEDWYSKSA